jgi:hypothetical protein
VKNCFFLELEMKITEQDIRNMIIQEMKTGSPYYGDEHHERFDFEMAPFVSFTESFEALVTRFKQEIENSSLEAHQLEFLNNDLLERVQDSLSFAMQIVKLKIDDAKNPKNEQL